jgi:putative ABC transport system ATP-binding protein
VTIARSLVNNPAIVWADEPTGALDSHSANDIVDFLRALNLQSGLTIVVVTHDQQVGDRCDRIVRMRDGSIEPAVAAPSVMRDRFAQVGVTRETYEPVEALAV